MITHIIFDNNGVLTTSDKERTYGLVSNLLGCTVEKYIALLNKFVETLDTGKMTQENFYASIIKEGRFNVSVNELR